MNHKRITPMSKTDKKRLPNEMSEDELRSEVYRLYRIRAELTNRVRELEVVRNTLNRTVLTRFREDFRQIMRDVIDGRA